VNDTNDSIAEVCLSSSRRTGKKRRPDDLPTNRHLVGFQARRILWGRSRRGTRASQCSFGG
jgi:hypothetical protein